LFRFLSASLRRCRFAAELPLLVKKSSKKLYHGIKTHTNQILHTQSYLKFEGRLSTRLHFSHSAWFFILPCSKTVFIFTSPPQKHKNFWVALDVRLFLLAWAIFLSLPACRHSVIPGSYPKTQANVNRAPGSSLPF
jgi:hypothetical protein